MEIYLGNANEDRNKEAFDYIFGFKDDVEAKLNAALIWSRGEDAKSPKVHIRLHDVNIENEED